MRYPSTFILFSVITIAQAQWSSGGIFAVSNHFQAAAFQSPDTGVFVYGTDNPNSGEGGIIATYNGNSSGGFYMWYASPLNLEDVDVRWSNGFPYYMAAGSRQYNKSVIVKPYELFMDPLQFDSVHTGIDQYYRALRMRSDLVAFAGGGTGSGDGIIDMSVDTGATWVNVAMLPGQPISRLHFVNDQLGFAGTGGYRRLFNNGVLLPDSGAIYRTTDGGLTWSLVHADADHGFSDVAFSTTLNGVATRNDGAIFRTVDGGDTWSQALINAAAPFMLASVTFRPNGVAYAGGYRTDGSEGLILISTDGGSTWNVDFSTSALNHARRIYDLYFFTNGEGYASSHIRPLNHGGITTDVAAPSAYELQLYPNPARDKLFFTLPGPGPSFYELVDIQGRTHRSGNSTLIDVGIDVTGLAAGTYFLRIRHAQGAGTLTCIID